MTTHAVRTEVSNLDRSSEEEEEESSIEESSKDGTSALMAMAIGQALLKKKKELAVCNNQIARLVEQGPAANQPVDDSQSLVQVEESQGRRGAMAGCMSQGGGCNKAFTIASGNRAGNSEDDEDDLAEIESSAQKKTTKLALDATTKAKEETTKLVSDATTKNIALCDGDQGGSLPCSRVEPNKGGKTGNKPSDCPDDLSKGKFFFQDGLAGQGRCYPLSADSAIQRTTLSTYEFPGLKEKYVVLTKPGIVHPTKSDKTVAGFFLKRMVCTVDSPITCRTYKVGICAKCHGDVAFRSTYEEHAWPKDFEGKKALAKRFVDECLLKKAYDECKGEDLKHFNNAQSAL